jgi:hypothetical protein
VVVNGASAGLGHVWSLAGGDRLAAASNGVLCLAGQGGSRYVASTGAGHVSPVNDSGVLVKTGS